MITEATIWGSCNNFRSKHTLNLHPPLHELDGSSWEGIFEYTFWIVFIFFWLFKGDSIAPGPQPEGFPDHLLSWLLPVILDVPRPLHPFGSCFVQPKKTATAGEIVTAEFVYSPRYVLNKHFNLKIIFRFPDILVIILRW